MVFVDTNIHNNRHSNGTGKKTENTHQLVSSLVQTPVNIVPVPGVCSSSVSMSRCEPSLGQGNPMSPDQISRR